MSAVCRNSLSQFSNTADAKAPLRRDPPTQAAHEALFCAFQPVQPIAAMAMTFPRD